MTEADRRPDIAAELRPYVDKTDAEAINELAARLSDAKPVPRAAFRGELRARLAEREQGAGIGGWRPQRLGATIAAYAGSGLSLLALAALGVSGAGPLG